MQKLNVRFSDDTKVRLQLLSFETGISGSSIARAAMEIGLKELSRISNRDNLKFANVVKSKDKESRK